MKKLALLILLFAVLTLAAHAATRININTADAALLDSLPGIGPSKAAAIVGYRTEHGPFAGIADIQDVSGIGPSTYANIEALIAIDDAGDPGVQSEATSSPPVSASSPTPRAPANEPSVTVDAGADRVVIAGADTAYTATAAVGGAPYPTPEVHWAWGDGSSATGASVLKSYALPGTYLVGVSALAGAGSGESSLRVTVEEPQVAVTGVSSSGITIANGDASDTLDLSYWQLSAGARTFTFPAGTKIVAGGSVTFDPAITGLVGATEASLLYPSGKVVTIYEPSHGLNAAPVAGATSAKQPAPAQASSHLAQAVASVPRTNNTPHAHATQPARAPATSTELAAAGAALPALNGTDATSSGGRSTSGLAHALKSPWVLGALGLLAFSGAALIVL